MLKSFCRVGIWAVALCAASVSFGANQYWDADGAAGLQHGGGVWSAVPGDAFWSPVVGGGALGPWTNGNSAYFSATAGVSAVAVSGVVTAGVLNINGSAYTLTLAGGASLSTTNDSFVGNGAGMNENGLVIEGGVGVATWNLGGRTATIGSAGLLNTGNYVRIDGAGLPGGAMMTNLGALFIAGNGSSLTLTNGARVFGTPAFSDLRLGNNGTLDCNNRLVITPDCFFDGGGTAPRLLVGEGNKGTNNTALIDGGVLTNAGGVQIFGTNSGFTVKNGGALYSKGALTLNASSNFLLLDNGLASFAGSVSVGSRCQIEAANGSRLVTLSTESVIGSGAATVFSSVRIAGGSTWDSRTTGNVGIQLGSGGAASNTFIIDNGVVTNCGRLLIGDTGGRYNTMTITNNGRFYEVGGTRYIGASPGALGNRVLIAGGAGVTSLWDVGVITLSVGTSTGSVVRIDGAGAPGSAVAANVGPINLGAGVRATENELHVANGGALYSAGLVYIAASGAAGATNNAIRVSGAGSLWDEGSYILTVGMTGNTNNLLEVSDNGVVTNAGSVVLAGTANSLTISGGGRLYPKGLSVGTVAGSDQNAVLVTGAGSRLDLLGNAVAIGNSAGTTFGNSLTLEQGAEMDYVGTLTVGTNSVFNFAGGTLGLSNAVCLNGPFQVGDGVQAATLEILGGVCAFSNGLVVSPDATLLGLGTLSGGAPGVQVANGATFSPGLGAPGSLIVAGSNLTWAGGGVYCVEVTDMKSGPGIGWDLMTVNSQLNLTFSGPARVIKLDSLGTGPANYDAGQDYNLRIMTYGAQAGYDVDDFALDLSAFQPGGAWSLTNANNALWLVYRGASAPGSADYTWNAPNTGPWSAAGNWAGAAAPPAGGGESLALAFGDTGVRYTATNNLAGTFHLNQLRFSSVSSSTGALAGNAIALTNSGARVDYLAGENGAIIISNAVRLAADTEFGGNAFGGTLSMAGAVTTTGALTKRGSWDLVFPGTGHLFDGPFIVDSPGGRVIAITQNALAGSGPIIISNGVIQTGGSGAYFASVKPNRRMLVKGPGALWSNAYMNLALRSTNVQVIVDGGRLLCSATLAYFFAGSDNGLFMVTNGGYAVNGGNAVFVGDSSTNCQFVITGTNSSMYMNQYICAGGGAGISNSILIEQGGLLRGANNFSLWAGSGTNARYNTVTVKEGGLVYPSGVFGKGVSNTFVIRDPGSVVNSQGSYVSSVGSGSTDFGNTLTVANQGLLTNLSLQLAVGGAWSNSLTVTTGGRVVLQAADAFIALGTNSNTDNNRLTVSGSGSLWNNAARSLTVCQGTGTLNRLVVEAGGLVTNIATLVVAVGSAASGNGVTVDGGQLQAGTLTFNNALSNDVVLTGGGVLSAVNLFATNLNNAVAFNGGTLNVKTALVNNGGPFIAGDGAQDAVLTLMPNGRVTATGGFVITNNAVFAGSGILEATSTVFGAFSPGSTGVGIVTNIGDLAFQPGAMIPLNLAAPSAPGAGWDLVLVTNGNLTLGGVLKPILPLYFAPASDQRFLIMTNVGPGSVSGAFANAGDGQSVTLQGEDGSARIGAMTVEIGPQGVVLADFRPWRPSGSVIIVR